MPLTREEFAVLQANQFCGNENCQEYGLAGHGNIRKHSFATGQVYCVSCHGKPFSVRKGTMFYGIRTPVEKIVKVLTLIASGMGQNAVCRSEDVTADSVRSWIILAAGQVSAFTEYMQREMKLSQVQIDEFWSFIKKKGESDRGGSKSGRSIG